MKVCIIHNLIVAGRIPEDCIVYNYTDPSDKRYLKDLVSSTIMAVDDLQHRTGKIRTFWYMWNGGEGYTKEILTEEKED